MAYNKTEKIVFEIAEPIALAQGLSIWDVEFKKDGRDYYLRVYIDKSGGVSIDDCEVVSKALSQKLDDYDPIEQAYCLEVCSAGLDRLLKRESDFLAFLGSDVDVKLYSPINGKKDFTAVLKAYENNAAVLDTGEGIITLPLEKAASIRLSVKF